MQVKSTASGFTLIELVIGIVVLSLSFSIIFTMILPTATQGAIQIHQIRAAELGQSLMSEIMGKAFDENSDMMGGVNRCGEDMDLDADLTPDPCMNILGNEEDDTRSLFDDVDDYHGYTGVEDSINDGAGNALSDIYSGFKVNVTVIHDSDYDGVPDTVNANDINVRAKLITVTVTSAEGVEIKFSSYKANF